jgi:hypothetical protein
MLELKLMRRNGFVFAFFAAAILFSMVREWNAPASCLRSVLAPSASHQLTR